MKVEVIGVEPLDNLFRKLPQEVRDKLTTQAYRAGAKILKKKAKELIAKDSGDTAESIDIFTETKGEQKGTVYVSLNYKKKGYVGRFLEFGTSKMSAKPFMRPAFDATKDDIRLEIRKRLAFGLRLLTKKYIKAKK